MDDRGEGGSCTARARRRTTLSTDQPVWERLLGCYAGLEEVRHSLTHRKATVLPTGDLVGVDRTGQPLQPMAETEQFALCRAVSCLLAAFETQSMPARERNEAMFYLDHLTACHGQKSTGTYERTYPIPQIEVVLDPPYELPLSRLHQKFLGKFGSHEVNLVVRFNETRGNSCSSWRRRRRWTSCSTRQRRRRSLGAGPYRDRPE